MLFTSTSASTCSHPWPGRHQREPTKAFRVTHCHVASIKTLREKTSPWFSESNCSEWVTATRHYLSACRDARSAEAWEQRSWKELEGQPRPSTDVPGPPTASFLITAHFVLACLNYSFSLTKTRSPVVGGPGGYWENTEPFDARMGTSQRWFM